MELLSAPEHEQETMTLMEEAWETYHAERPLIDEHKSLDILQAALRGGIVNDPAPLRRAKIITWPRVAAAAAIIILFTVGLYWNGRRHQTDSLPIPEIAVAKGIDQPVAYTRQYRLPDGSTVILRANSKLDYLQTDGGKTREVRLTGEAYFDIAKDPARPFIIHTGDIQTTVLGTAFDVMAYPGAMRVVVSVTQGKVKVENKARLLAVLEPNRQMTYTIPAGSVQEEKVDASAIVTGWTKEGMAFEGNSFAVIADAISLRYGVTVGFKNPGLGKCMVKAYFNGTEPLEKVLEVLCTISNASYTKEGENKVLIDGAGCE
jgi:ferric-dicitrate binding protein FerR (iron transport regulator)